jgi:hypothetical protein
VIEPCPQALPNSIDESAAITRNRRKGDEYREGGRLSSFKKPKKRNGRHSSLGGPSISRKPALQRSAGSGPTASYFFFAAFFAVFFLAVFFAVFFAVFLAVFFAAFFLAITFLLLSINVTNDTWFVYVLY